MGNRTSLGEGPGFARMTTWTPNGLNQYSSVNRPGTFDVTGRRSPGASIEVNGQAVGTGTSSYQPTSNGLYFHGWVYPGHSRRDRDPATTPTGISASMVAGR